MIRIKDAQNLIREKFLKTDRERGLHLTFIWFVEEVGELAEAIKEMKKEKLEEEIADVFAWLLSIANLLDLDLDNAFRKKYL